jgi:HSP20 family molecular chaperone IbpA
MFKKKSCKNCGEKVSEKNNFCPSCGNPLNENPKKQDFGMLGKNDAMQEQNPFENMFKGFGGGMMNKMLNNAMKMLEKEMQKSEKTQNQNNPNIKSSFELFINGKRINPVNIKVTKRPAQQKQVNEKPKEISLPILNAENKKQFLKLSKKEPKTNLRRLSDQVIYELEIPGVKSIENISIVKLENSIEIKAVAKNKSYEKIIPFSMQILKYYLENETLILEMKSE